MEILRRSAVKHRDIASGPSVVSRSLKGEIVITYTFLSHSANQRMEILRRSAVKHRDIASGPSVVSRSLKGEIVITYTFLSHSENVADAKFKTQRGKTP
jgi:hypothetical protein